MARYLLILCIILAGCQTQTLEPTQIRENNEDGPVITGPDVVEDEFRTALLEKWKVVEVPSVDAKRVSPEDWHFGLGDPANGLTVMVEQKPALDTTLTLPHRILKPDWPMWYEKLVDMTGYNWLYIDADDGAQVFQDGKRLEPAFGEFFELTSSGKSTLTIRVLNNAMKGGLEDVLLIEGPAFETYRSYREQRVDMQLVMYEALRAEALSDTQKEALEAMLDGASTASAPATASARAQFAQTLQYPYLPKNTQSTDDTFSFTAWGDSQAGWDTFQQLISHMIQQPADFSIGLGDLVGFGSKEEQWVAFTAALQPLMEKQKVYPVAGNHDFDGYYNDLIPDLYYQYTREENTNKTYFSWTHKGAYFIALDPNRSFPLGFEDEQVEWMLAEMNSRAWREANWRFIMMHQIPFGQGWPGYHGDVFIQELVDSLAVPKQIDFVLGGHNHDYERLAKAYGDQQVNFFILGGGGGGLEPEESSAYPVMDKVIKAHNYARFDMSPDKVAVTVYGLEGEVLDEVVVEKE